MDVFCASVEPRTILINSLVYHPPGTASGPRQSFRRLRLTRACNFVRQAGAYGSPNFFKCASFDLPHPLARNAISCRELLTDRRFGQDPRFKDAALSRVNHAWRHLFKSVARDVRMDREVEGFITGHRPKDSNAGNDYGDRWIRIAALTKPPAPHKRHRRNNAAVAAAKVAKVKLRAARERRAPDSKWRLQRGRDSAPVLKTHQKRRKIRAFPPTG